MLLTSGMKVERAAASTTGKASVAHEGENMGLPVLLLLWLVWLEIAAFAACEPACSRALPARLSAL